MGPQDFNPLIPELVVADLAVSLAFYVDRLDWVVAYDRPEEGFAFLEHHGSQLMLDQEGPGSWLTGSMERPLGRGVNLSIETPDLERLVAALAGVGHQLFRPIETRSYRVEDRDHRERHFLVQDPDGHLLRFVETGPTGRGQLRNGPRTS